MVEVDVEQVEDDARVRVLKVGDAAAEPDVDVEAGLEAGQEGETVVQVLLPVRLRGGRRIGRVQDEVGWSKRITLIFGSCSCQILKRSSCRVRRYINICQMHITPGQVWHLAQVLPLVYVR